MSAVQTIRITTMYDKTTKKFNLLVDNELLNALRVDLYKYNRTNTTALELLDWLETCLIKATHNTTQ